MKITHIANPVGVEAVAIIEAKQVPGGARLKLADGSERQVPRALLARHDPVPGDYFVIDAGDFEYISPKAAFDRDFGTAPEVPVQQV
jgi:hypothetical protein